MLILITGGSKQGKSSAAEDIICRFECKKYYIATMQPFGRDAEEAIVRHRKMREGKEFITIEKYTDIADIDIPNDSAVLVECLGNLCANEMFSSGEVKLPAEKIIGDIKVLSEKCRLLVLVSNQVGEDGIEYPTETMKYIRQLGIVNCGIADMADCVIECVYGIPIYLKGRENCF